jgi:hypothetical protein
MRPLGWFRPLVLANGHIEAKEISKDLAERIVLLVGRQKRTAI